MYQTRIPLYTFVQFPPGQSNSSEELAKKYYSQISKENIVKLYKKFEVDFQMFGYDTLAKEFLDMGL